MRQKIRRMLQATQPALSRSLAAPSAAANSESLASLTPAVKERLLLEASDAICNHIGVPASDHPPTLARETLRETIIHERRAARAFVSRRPASVLACTIDGETVSVDDLFVDSAAGILSFLPSADETTFAANAAVVVDYAAGYVTALQAAEDPAPTGPAIGSDLETATIIAAQHLKALQDRSQFDVAANVEEDKDLGRLETRYFNADGTWGLPSSVRALIDRYRSYVPC